MSKTETTLLYRQDLIDIPEVIPRIPCEIEILKPQEYLRLAEIRTVSDKKMDQFLQRDKRGDLCFVATHNGQMLSYAWLQTSGIHPIQPAGRSLPVKAGEAWLFDGGTAVWARGNNVYSFLLNSMFRYLQTQAFNCAWGYTTRSNIASQKGIVKAGFKLTARLYCLEFAGFVLPLPAIPC